MSSVLGVFLIAALGYGLGAVRVRGLCLGTSGVLIVALLFGHFGFVIPAVVRNFGLVLFVGAVGLIAGPVFFRNFRKKVYAFLLLGVLIVLVGSLLTVLLGKLFRVPFDLAIGMFTGALTSTPGLATATEATEAILGAGNSMASVGYGIAYPFGVIGVVLFVQLFPKLSHCDIQKERELLHRQLHERSNPATEQENAAKFHLNEYFVLMAVLCLGVALGSVKIPLPKGLSFSLGSSGGPLFTGLLAGHFRRIKDCSLQVSDELLKTLRELGLCLFLLGAGTDAGTGFVEILKQYGAVLFFIGVLITLVPMIVACLAARRFLKMDTLSTLGTVCGGMTSTPALGTLISSCEAEDVAASYAATYPFALICVVLSSQIMAMVW